MENEAGLKVVRRRECRDDSTETVSTPVSAVRLFQLPAR